MKKIAFFDIDGTLTSEIDGSLPESAIHAIRRARTFGHLMFINTGRCFQNVEPRFRRIGFDGYAARTFSAPARKHCTLPRRTALPCSF